VIIIKLIGDEIPVRFNEFQIVATDSCLETLALHVDNMARRKKRLKKQKINRNRKSKEGQTIK
jgi:hypothetical protein